MKILVCFKAGPDLDKVVDADWDEFSLSTDLSYASRVLGCFDESALEMALRVKEALSAQGSDALCTAVTIGAVPPSSVWQGLYAAGYDEVSVIQSATATDFLPGWVAGELAAFAGKGGYDMILTGRQAGLADTASVPWLLAEALGWPAVGDAETVEIAEKGLQVVYNQSDGRARLTVSSPVVIAVGNSPVSALRAVTLRAKLAAAKQQTRLLEPVVPFPGCPSPVLRREASNKVCRFLDASNIGTTARCISEMLKK